MPGPLPGVGVLLIGAADLEQLAVPVQGQVERLGERRSRLDGAEHQARVQLGQPGATVVVREPVGEGRCLLLAERGEVGVRVTTHESPVWSQSRLLPDWA